MRWPLMVADLPGVEDGKLQLTLEDAAGKVSSHFSQRGTAAIAGLAG